MEQTGLPTERSPAPGAALRSFPSVGSLFRWGIRSLKKDLPLKLIAFALAISLWAMVSEEPDVEGTFALPVDVSFPERLVLTSPAPQAVTVYLKASRSRLKSLPIRELELPLDLSEALPGETTFRLENARIRNLPGGIVVVGYSPSTLSFQLDVREYKTVPVVVRQEGSLPAGKKLKELKVKPDTVSLEGPRSVLHSLTELATRPLPLSTVSQSETRLVELDIGNQLLRTRNGQDRVQVTLVLEELLVQKRLPGLKVRLAEGLRKYTPDPAEVSLVLEGLPQQLEQLEPEEILVHARLGQTETVPTGDPLLLRLLKDGKSPERPHIWVELPDGSGLKLLRMSPPAVELRAAASAAEPRGTNRSTKDRPKR